MKALRILFIFCLLSSLPVAAQTDIISAAYGLGASVSAAFFDPNAGTTAFRILNLPFGGYEEGMASALTAFPVEASAISINPAASSLLDSTELSVFHNNWIGESKIEGAVYSLRFGNLGLGLAGRWFYAPFAERDDFDTVNVSYYSETMAIVNAAYTFFSGYYFDGIAVGANLKLAYRSVPDYGDDEGNIIVGSGLEQSALAIMADFGLLSRFNFLKLFVSRSKNASLGLAVKNLGPPIFGESLPTSISLGASYAPMRPLTIVADISKPLDLANPLASEAMVYALAVDASLLEFFSLHGGFQLKGGNPRFSVGAAFALANVDIVANYTLDLTTQFKDLNRFSIEAKLNLGDQGRYAIRLKVEEYYLRGVQAYAEGKVNDAIEFWNEAIRLDPGFDPARESRRTAVRALELEKRMEELQRLEN